MFDRNSLLGAIGIVALTVVTVHAQAVRVTKLPSAVKTHCFACHDSFSAEAELDLETLSQQPSDLHQVASQLEKIQTAVTNGVMPPQDAEPQPTAEERETIVAWAKGNWDRLAEAFDRDPGHVVMPRLTRYEYRNVLRDLSNGVVTNAGRFLPNEGGAGEGFANVGQAQGMSTTQLEKYLEAAKGALRYLRVNPHAGFVWDTIPRDPVDEPAKARKELTDAIIAWYVGQQQKWGEEHREALNQQLGFIHAAYLEAAWKFRRCEEAKPLAEFAHCDQVRLSPVALQKWWNLLNDTAADSPFADWAAAWRELPDDLNEQELRRECIAITTGERRAEQPQNFAPKYEVSFHKHKQQVLATAEQEKYWPFRIEIGDAEELFLVVTDAGDGGNGEYALWRRGRVIFEEGTSQPWEQVVTIKGANSGRTYPWGIDGEGAAKLGKDSIGVRPPGALKFAVPKKAKFFEVELAIDDNRTKEASIQALVLKEKSKSQSFIPGRYVFGGKKRNVAAKELSKQKRRALRKRNVAEANRTKIGLNAERNVFSQWKHTPLEYIGGPWPDQSPDEAEPQFPYHYTVGQVLRNATEADLSELRQLEQHLRAITQPTQQKLLALAKANGWERSKEGVLPPASVTEQWDKASQTEFRTLVTKLADEEKDLEQRVRGWLKEFTTRAWRRPVTSAELELLLSLYRESREQGFSFDSSVKSPLLVVLASPHFLYRGTASVSTNANRDWVPLSDYQLASRLSFFLWGSIPDEELLEVATRGELQSPQALKQQVRRMLQDPKARSLATDFAGQFWGFSDFENFTGPDEQRFAEFTPELRTAMVQEVELFLDDLFRNDRPLTNLLAADYTFVNRDLAQHYGVDSIADDAFHKVTVDTRRGGLASMALFLTKSSLPLRTSPVQRGVWLLEQVLGEELPNPPADVPPLSEDDKNAQGESIREQLKRHRESPSCASCHNRIDPLGIALENYDAIGRWRETERDGSPLANESVSHDGIALPGVSGLKRYLLQRQDEVFRHFNRKLLGYALGRAVGPGDHSLLNEMQTKLKSKGYRFSVLIETIASSPQFRYRRTEKSDR